MKKIALAAISATALLGLAACADDPAQDTTINEFDTVEPMQLPEDTMAGDTMLDDPMADDVFVDDTLTNDPALDDTVTEEPAM